MVDVGKNDILESIIKEELHERKGESANAAGLKMISMKERNGAYLKRKSNCQSIEVSNSGVVDERNLEKVSA